MAYTTTAQALQFANAVAAEAGMLADMLKDEMQYISLVGASSRACKAAENIYGIVNALDNLHDQAQTFASRMDEQKPIEQ